MIGFFANTLVLRSRIDPTLAFHEFLHRVRTTSLDAFAHHRSRAEETPRFFRARDTGALKQSLDAVEARVERVS